MEKKKNLEKAAEAVETTGTMVRPCPTARAMVNS